jgi:hypothetical protein
MLEAALMSDEASIDVLNRGYACPPDAGPAWRAAASEGMDLSLVELSLAKTPWERWIEHDDALGFARRLQEALRRPHGEA